MASYRLKLAHELAGTWAEILDVDHVGLDDDVLALGVDSLAMTQMILRVKEDFGVEFTFDDIFEAPTVAALALRVESSQKRTRRARAQSGRLPEGTARAKRRGVKPLSIVQERMLGIERKLPGLPQFNLPFAYRWRARWTLRRSNGSLAGVSCAVMARCARHLDGERARLFRAGHARRRSQSQIDGEGCFVGQTRSKKRPGEEAPAAESEARRNREKSLKRIDT